MTATPAKKPQDWSIPILVGVILLFLGPLVMADFTKWDDDSTVSRNSKMNPPSLANVGYFWTHSAGELYVPVTYTVWSILAAAAKLDAADPTGITLNPMIFHGANLLVHALSACLVLSILTRLTGNRTASLIGALVWAVHPVQVETVAWVSGMKDLLWGCFALAAIDQYLRFAAASDALNSLHKENESRSFPVPTGSPLSVESVAEATTRKKRVPPAPPEDVATGLTLPRLRAAHYSLATLFFVVAMLSKPSGMVTPLIVIAIDFVFLKRQWQQIIKSTWFWFLLTIPLMIVTRLVQTGHNVDGGPLWARPLIALDSLAFYLGKLLWPFNLTPDYGHRPGAVIASGEIWWGWSITVLAAALAAWQYRRRPWIAGGCLIFVAGCLQMLGWLPFSFQFFSTTTDHYLYVSMLGIAMIVAYLIAALPRTQPVLVTAGVIIALLGARSFTQTRYWADNKSLFTHITDVRPDNFSGYYLYAQTLVDAGDYTTAEPLLRKAISIEPRFPKSHDALATVLLNTGRTDEAIEQMQLFLKNASENVPALRTQLADTRSTLGLYFLKHGQNDKAAAEFRKALILRPDDPMLKKLLKQVDPTYDGK